MKPDFRKSWSIIVGISAVVGVLIVVQLREQNLDPAANRESLRSTSNLLEPAPESAPNPQREAHNDSVLHAEAEIETDPAWLRLSSIREQLLSEADADVASYFAILDSVNGKFESFQARNGMENPKSDTDERYARISRSTGKTVDEVRQILETARERNLTRPVVPDFTNEAGVIGDSVAMGLENNVSSELWRMVSGDTNRYTVLDVTTECRDVACRARILFPADRLLEEIISPEQVMVELESYGFDGFGARAGYQPEPTPMQFLEIYLWRKEPSTQAHVSTSATKII